MNAKSTVDVVRGHFYRRDQLATDEMSDIKRPIWAGTIQGVNTLI